MTDYRIPWSNRSDKPGELGRHVNHDPQSRAFAHQPSSTVLQSKVWARHFPVLHQSVGACTGNAMLGAVYTGKLYDALSSELKAKYPVKAQTFESRVYEYYNPTVEDKARPVELTVTAK